MCSKQAIGYRQGCRSCINKSIFKISNKQQICEWFSENGVIFRQKLLRVAEKLSGELGKWDERSRPSCVSVAHSDI